MLEITQKDLSSNRPSGIIRKASLAFSWGLLVLLYIHTFTMIWKYSVNVPYWDEWEYFTADALPTGLTWHWLFKFHNEHRIVFTKLLAWMNLKIFGLNFARQQIFNFGIYGCLLAAVFFLKVRIAGKDRFHLFPLFMLFLLSPLNYENHLWAFQSQFHLVMIFFILALISAFPKRLSGLSMLSFVIPVVLAIYSFSAGVIFAVVCTGFVLTYIAKSCLGDSGIKSRLLFQSAIMSAIICIALLCWFQGYRKPPLHPELVTPFSTVFLDFFLGLAGFGFGYRPPSMAAGRLIGGISLISVLFPVLLLFADKKKRWLPSTWTVMSGTTATLVLLATISMARAEIEVPTVSRYNEFAVMLVPLAALSWWLAVQQKSLRTTILSLFWLFCLVGYFDRQSFSSYDQVRSQRKSALECISQYYAGSGDGICPMTYDQPINGFLDRAKLLRVGFSSGSDFSEKLQLETK
ncbi:MAG: hypothetical protein HXX17_08990 [Geobacteraceae bacterium]|nr:hypothetical protein [Geobacteraceae bacterium]